MWCLPEPRVVALSVGATVELAGRFSLYAAKGRVNFDVFPSVVVGRRRAAAAAGGQLGAGARGRGG
ncbi:MAG: hypothetical protein ACLTDR_00670 [Adlercreutzia equolifaciens]